MERIRRLVAALVSLFIIILVAFPTTHVTHAQTFTRVGALTLNPGENHLGTSLINPGAGFAYFGTGACMTGGPPWDIRTRCGLPGVAKVKLSDFTRVGNLTLSEVGGEPSTSVIDSAAGFAYFGVSRPVEGIVVKVRLSDFAVVGLLTLNPGENGLESSTIDLANGFAYFGMWPGVIVKIRLSDFTRVADLRLIPGENVNPTASLIDSTAGFAYFGISSNPGNVVKVRLSDFSLVGSLTFNLGENGVNTAVIDSVGGLAYFVIYNGIVKVRLSDFTRVGGILALNPGENQLSSAVIDPAGSFAYFSTYPYNAAGTVVKVKLSDLTRVGSVVMNFGEEYLCCAVIDPAAGFAYFGATDYGRFIAGSYPGVVVKIQIAPPLVGPLDTLRLWARYLGLALGVAAVAVATIILVDRRSHKKKEGPGLPPIAST